MSDLVSREALLKEFNQTAIEWLQDGTYQLQFAAGVMCEVMKMVTEAPTVDAVEMVRCKDCKSWYPYRDEKMGHCTCMYMQTPAEGYCFESKRKEKKND